MPSLEHQSAAVLFSDIEGYTTMMSQNEGLAIEAVNRYQTTLEEAVVVHSGQVMQHYGDGSLTIFPKAEDAIACALDLQRRLRETIPLRMGIHYGKVVYHHQKVFGDTVNIASRIESLGKAGTVLFSQDVLKQIEHIPAYKPVSMGHYRFKNVAQTMEIFALGNEGLYLPKPGSLQGKLQSRESLNNIRIATVGLLAVLGVILALLYKNLAQPSVTNSSDRTPAESSIAVLPFANLSTDSTQEYFADGLAQEVLILLTQEPQLRVTSRSSSFTFKGQQVDIPTVAEKLGVQYILDGSVRKAGDSVRISAQLVDAIKDQQLWAQSWQRSMGDLLAIQQEIADSVKHALKLQILTNRRQRIQSIDPEPYTLFLQARHIGQQGNVNGLLNAETLLRKVLELDSTYAPAWAYLSTILNRQSNIGLRPSIEGHELARQAANQALSIDSINSNAWSAKTSIAIYFDRDFEQAEFYLKKAFEIEPNSLNNIKLASNLAFCFGDLQRAIELDRQAIKIDPINAKSFLDLGYDYYCDGEYIEAEQITKQGLLMSPDYLGGSFLLSLIFLEQGRLSEAKQAGLSEPYEILRIQAQSLIATSMGDPDSADYFLQIIKDRYSDVAPYQIAQIYGHQHKTDSAFKWLDLAYHFRDGGLVQLQVDPFMKRLKKDQRWNELLSSMGFPRK